MSRILYILTGPTAVGKTELALQWAEANNAEIISCDASLFYQGMDIGTAKPDKMALARVPHHLIDICPVNRQMDISRFTALARQAVESIAARGKTILITGGSGFYLKSFLAPVTDNVAVPDEIRNKLQERFQREGLPPLLEQLHKLNPIGLSKLDTANPRRVIRALERCIASGLTLEELSRNFASLPAPYAGYDIRITRLTRSKEDLNQRIKTRVNVMLGSGLVEEVEALLFQGIQENPSAANAIGYRETIAMLEGKLARNDLTEEIEKNTRRLVRKQNTWFRNQLPPHRELSAASSINIHKLF